MFIKFIQANDQWVDGMFDIPTPLSILKNNVDVHDPERKEKVQKEIRFFIARLLKHI